MYALRVLSGSLYLTFTPRVPDYNSILYMSLSLSVQFQSSLMRRGGSWMSNMYLPYHALDSSEESMKDQI